MLRKLSAMRCAIVAVCFTVPFAFACENKDHKNCLAQVDAYQAKLVECGKLSDEAKKTECLNRAEVSKITREDCDSSYK